MGRLANAWRILTQRDLASDQIGWQYRNRYAMGTGTINVTQETALRHSGWWACLRLRANLLSTLPADSFRDVGGRQVEVAKPDLLVEPYPGVDWTEHMYGSQIDLDRYGNSVGIIRARTALGLPAAIELAPMSMVSAQMRGYKIVEWRVGGETYPIGDIWHEKQYTIGGWPLGLSPLAYAAWSVGGFLSAQQFGLDWFGAGAQPAGTLRNTRQQIVKGLASEAKADFKAATANRDIFVTGMDWEWTPSAMDAASSGFLDDLRWGVQDVCRFLDVPGDMIDAPQSGSSVTYANITQRNTQLLVTSLGPAIVRRERAWSKALPKPRFVKLNTDAFLRLDPETRERVLLARVFGRTLAPSEARALDNLPPFTPDQLAEFATLFPVKVLEPRPPQAASQWEVPA